MPLIQSAVDNSLTYCHLGASLYLYFKSAGSYLIVDWKELFVVVVLSLFF
jgi:hypothetical protein